MYQWRRRVWWVSKHILVALTCLITLSPFYWMVRTSLVPAEDLYGSYSLFPQRVTFEHYQEVWNHTNFPRNVQNSLVVAGITTAASILVSTFGAYALSRYQFRYKTLYDRSLLLVYMLPSVAIAIPMFMIIRSYGLLDTHAALILSYTTSTLPFSIWMLRGYFQSVPYSLEEAAMIDGASRLQALFRVVLPVSLPGIAAVAAFAFILAWNEFLFASTFIQSSHKYTLAVGLRTFQQQFDVEFDLLMAASTISSIPIVVMFGFAQRFLVEGLTAGANKG